MKNHLLSLYDKIIHLTRSILDFLNSERLFISIGDLMTIRGEIDGNQFLVASRLLDVEAYRKNGDDSFRYQEELSSISEYDKTYWNESFRNTIKSYLNNGYNNKSRLILDKDAILRNGTHRTAMHLNLRIYESKALLVYRKWPFFDMSMKRYGQKLPQGSYFDIMHKLEEIQDQLLSDGVSFCALVSKSEYKKNNLLIDGLKINRTIDLMLPDNIVIKLDKKTFYCRKGMYVLILFTLSQPNYIVSSHKLISNTILNSTIPYCTFVSLSCYEGKHIYDQLTPYFLKEENVIIK